MAFWCLGQAIAEASVIRVESLTFCELVQKALAYPDSRWHCIRVLSFILLEWRLRQDSELRELMSLYAHRYLAGKQEGVHVCVCVCVCVCLGHTVPRAFLRCVKPAAVIPRFVEHMNTESIEWVEISNQAGGCLCLLTQLRLATASIQPFNVLLHLNFCCSRVLSPKAQKATMMMTMMTMRVMSRCRRP